MITLREAAHKIDPNAHLISVKAIARRVFLVGSVSVRGIIQLSQWWTRLNFVIQRQQQDQWCWAAVVASVSRFFDPNSNWTQCSLANAAFNRNDCCGSGFSDCNRAYDTEKALSITGNLQSSSGPITLTDIAQEIDAVRPICVRIEWIGGGTHAVVIDGYNMAMNMAAVDDPWGASYSGVVLSIFQKQYLGTGKWVRTFKVKASD